MPQQEKACPSRIARSLSAHSFREDACSEECVQLSFHKTPFEMVLSMSTWMPCRRPIFLVTPQKAVSFFVWSVFFFA